MKDALSDLHPSRTVARRMHELESELQRARMHLRRHSKNPETTGRWGLEQPSAPQQEEGWFITYLDMMTLLLVVMIVMLAFSGTLGEEPGRFLKGGRPASGLAADGGRATVHDAPDTGEPVSGVRPGPPAATSTAAGPAGTPSASSGSPATGAAAPAPTGPAGTIAAPSTAATAGTEALPAAPSIGGGTGLLPGGTGLLPGQAGAGDALAASEAYPGWAPLDAGPLPRDATIMAGRGALPAATRGFSDLYPGWSAADLAASFIGPPRPGTGAGGGKDAAGAPAASSPAQPPAEDDAPSEGETLAAGLSLSELGGDVEVVVNERSVSFRVNSEILFDSSQADLSRSGLAVLRRIVGVLSDTGHEVTVEGHTDAVPVRRNVRYPSNWELSSARAGSVVRYLQANGIDKTRLKAIGYADAHPIGDNHTPEGRARNRRVELVIEKRD